MSLYLAGHFLSLFASRENKGGLSLSEEALELLKQYSWPGNIRELRNVIYERAVFAGMTIKYYRNTCLTKYKSKMINQRIALHYLQ